MIPSFTHLDPQIQLVDSLVQSTRLLKYAYKHNQRFETNKVSLMDLEKVVNTRKKS